MKIAIFSGNNNFMANNIMEMDRRGHEVRYYDLGPNNTRLKLDNEALDAVRMYDMMTWADVLFVEFAEMYAPLVSHMKAHLNLLTPLVIRLHRIELYEPFLEQVNWSAVDRMVFVAPQCQRKFNFDVDSVVIPNGYDAELFGFQHRVYSNRILLAGNGYWKKGYYEAIEFMQELDEKWSLTIIADPRPPDGHEYLQNCVDLAVSRGLSGRVFFGNKLSRQDFADRLGDYDIVLSASLEEGTHCVVAEGMLTGAYPLIRHWVGADEMYPEECVFDTWSGFKEKLDWWDGLPVDQKIKASEHMRNYVVKRYDYVTQARKLVDVLEQV